MTFLAEGMEYLKVPADTDARIEAIPGGVSVREVAYGGVAGVNAARESFIEDVEDLKAESNVLMQDGIKVVIHLQIHDRRRRQANLRDQIDVVAADCGPRREISLARLIARTCAWIRATGAAPLGHPVDGREPFGSGRAAAGVLQPSTKG